MKREAEELGRAKIGKLLKKFAIPCVISMLVAALYNIVDQIFIGWSEAGTGGNAATNIVYPFTLIALALALLIGDGAAALFSLSLGAKDFKKANKSIGNGFLLLILCSIVVLAGGLIFEEQILALFGGNPAEAFYQFAKDYFTVICLGVPFYIIGQGLNGAIRADGAPRWAMAATMAGAVANIILDPIFIFGLGMSVKGAAIATVLGQILTFALSLLYLGRAKSFRITKASLSPDKLLIKTVLGLGVASFITQISIVIIIAVSNNLLGKYGYETLASTGVAFGVQNPLAVVGICMKVFGIVISAVIGVSLGGQPIIGYNMGAGKPERVKETIRKILLVNSLIGLVAFLLFEFAPQSIINIFGSATAPEYQEFANYCLRIYLGGIILTCIIKSTSVFLQSMGASLKSMILALARDVLFFVPAIIVLATISGSIVTMLWSSVIADILAFLLAMLFLKQEFRNLGRFAENSVEPAAEFQAGNARRPHLVVTIAREYGSGGHFVGKLLAEKLGIKFYDKELIDLAAKESGLTQSYIKEVGEKLIESTTGVILFEAEKQVIEKIAAAESCVIVGRCADYILRNRADTIKIFLYNTPEQKFARVVKYYGKKKSQAKKLIARKNAERKKYYEFCAGREWGKRENYDFMINVDKYGVEKTAEDLARVITT